MRGDPLESMTTSMGGAQHVESVGYMISSQADHGFVRMPELACPAGTPRTLPTDDSPRLSFQDDTADVDEGDERLVAREIDGDRSSRVDAATGPCNSYLVAETMRQLVVEKHWPDFRLEHAARGRSRLSIGVLPFVPGARK
jgi:hypothetical protein